VLAVSSVESLKANTITLNLDTVLSGKSPAGLAPWVTATFTDVGPNSVRLTLRATDLTPGEFLGRGALYFNLAPDVSHLTTSFIGGQKGHLKFGADAFNAGGNGLFDAELNFAQAGKNRFTRGEKSVWLLHGHGLNAADILALSLGGNNSSEGLYVASHFQGSGLGRSGDWITDTPPGGTTGETPLDTPSAVPIPPALVLFGSGLVGLGLLSRRKLSERVEL
jgi:hypothetical protein